MGEEIDNLNVVLFKIRIMDYTSSQLDEEQLSTTWGYIKLVRDIIQGLTHYPTVTVKNLLQIHDKPKNRECKTESEAFEVKKLA